MHESSIDRRSLTAVTTLLLALAAIALPATASAGEPATVTVRVEGFQGATLLAQTQVTTTSASVPVEGGTCSGTSAGGALYDAVKGNWKAVNASSGVEILGIDGVDLPPFGSENYAYWSVWVNDAFAKNGACTEELSPGADVVFAAQCFATGSYCPTNTSAPEHFLTSTRPSASTVNINESVSLKIGSLSTETGEPEAKLPPEVTVSGGPAQLTPQEDGTTTVTFTSPGLYTLQAHAPGSVPSDPQTVCVHNGNDGNCGTTAPSGSSTTTTTTTGTTGTTVSNNTKPSGTETPKVTGLKPGYVYARHGAPRLLKGSVVLPTGVFLRSVQISLKRKYHGHCFGFDGKSQRFVAISCKRAASFFSVGSSASFSYLLPARLPRGFYTYDIQAVNSSGESTKLENGVSHVTFTVH
jgi:hypothetical protein